MFNKNRFAIINGVLISFFGICQAQAALPGFYIGGQVGIGQDTYQDTVVLMPNITISSHLSDTNTALAGGGFFGYQFNKNWALEAGYTQFSSHDFVMGDFFGLKTDFKQYAMDVLAKGILPFTPCFNAFGKLGLVYVANIPSSSLLSNQTQIDPVIAGGLSYDITPHLPISVTYTRFQQLGNDKIPSSNLFTFDLAWHFG